MPAVTADTLTLTKLPTVEPTTRIRSVHSVTTAPRGFEGEGFPVHRAFAGIDAKDLDPFIMMDEMGAVDYAPYEPRGTDWHPHRGFETVTYMIDGRFAHQDSHGGGGLIADGATQWMTAGSGIHHCLGAALARLEGRVAIGTLIRRFPEIELATDTPAWNGRLVLRGLDTLPVTAT